MRKCRVAYPMSSAAEQLAKASLACHTETEGERGEATMSALCQVTPKRNGNPAVSIFYVLSIASSASEPNNDARFPSSFLRTLSICASNLC